MSKNKGNQIRNRMIRSHEKTDRKKKLSPLERHIHKNHPEIGVTMEPFMAFTKGEDEYVGNYGTLDEPLVDLYTIHPPDMILSTLKHNEIAFELDGDAHTLPPGKKDRERNARYELNRIPYIVINEAELKEKLGIPESRPLTQEQINLEFDRRLEEL